MGSGTNLSRNYPTYLNDADDNGTDIRIKIASSCLEDARRVEDDRVNPAQLLKQHQSQRDYQCIYARVRRDQVLKCSLVLPRFSDLLLHSWNKLFICMYGCVCMCN